MGSSGFLVIKITYTYVFCDSLSQVRSWVLHKKNKPFTAGNALLLFTKTQISAPVRHNEFILTGRYYAKFVDAAQRREQTAP